jgi:SAM-dependent methyltransferase
MNREACRGETRLDGLAALQRVTGVPAENLLQVLELEIPFHRRILSEPDPRRRLDLCAGLYSSVHPLLSTASANAQHYEQIAKLFAREFRNRSILDAGCGDGALLRAIAAQASPSRLIGIDLYEFPNPADIPATFLRQDIVGFTLDHPVEVVVSSQVLEHIAPADLDLHLRSIHDALAPGGQVVVMTPNRLWGPHDITRLYDCTHTNRIPAMGSHLNELTYSELVRLLRKHGFGNIKTTLPFAERLPPFRSLRVPPVLNLLLERLPILRAITYLLKWRGRAAFKNPIVLVARKT